VTQPSELAHKGPVVEEWADLHFFRPLGIRLVARLAPLGVSADQVTVAALLVGLLAGHLFLYRSPVLNGLGLLLFLVSDILDSADGQLARLRGGSTRFGRILDGISDNLRFVNLYVHLIARLLLSHAMAPAAAVALAVAAGYSHSVQAAVADFLRQVYLFVAGEGGELDLVEDLGTERPLSRLARLELAVYTGYVARQAAWCPGSAGLVRALRKHAAPPGLAREWKERQAGPLARCALIAQNVRFLLLAVTALPGWPAGFFWLTLGPLNLALAWVLISHERTAAELSRARFAEPDLAVAGL
jgi:phosphatidylglycerophosphate synthase